MLDLSVSRLAVLTRLIVTQLTKDTLQNPGIASTIASTGNVKASVPNGLTSKTSNAFSNAYQTGSSNRDGKYFVKGETPLVPSL
jgi:hypothetical protein